MDGNRTPDRSELRKFGLVFGAVIALGFGWLMPLLAGWSYPLWPWLGGAGMALWSMVAPHTLAPLFRLWERFGRVMNAMVARLGLGLVFYLVVWPTGLVTRLRGRDPMRREWDAGASSYRVASENPSPERMEKPF